MWGGESPQGDLVPFVAANSFAESRARHQDTKTESVLTVIPTQEIVDGLPRA